MIFDHRTYNIKPNRLAKFLETYERLALPRSASTVNRRGVPAPIGEPSY
jgi:hypothetical protein